MMKNRAGLLALLVLAVATVIMVFFVMPRITGEKSPLTEAVNKASDTVKDAAKTATETAGEVAKTVADTANQAVDQTSQALNGDAKTLILEKMGRLQAEAKSATDELQALFADGKTPSADTLADARTKAVAAYDALKAMKLPEGLDASVAASFAAAEEQAAKALEMAIKASGGVSSAVATKEPAVPVPAADANAPTFDIVRVETDGSTVIAGKAKPDSRVEIVNGDTVITATTSDAGGNFAAVLDVPLAPGDYQLGLRVTGKDGVVSQSEEVATISVPKDTSGQLLAMVTKAGAASRILTAPVEPPVAKPADTATKEPVKAADTAATDQKAPTVDAAAVNAEVRVSAVELEGEKIFVAGTARPGSTVRIYADDVLIGELKADAGGNFVVDGKMTLSVGDHTIRADVVGSSGAVAFRATVPFNRPEGEQVAVVAPQANAGSPPAALAQLGGGEFDRIRNEASKAVALLQGLFADGKIPSAEELAAARSATEIALKSLSEFKLTDPADDATVAMVAKAADAAKSALETLKALPQDAATIGSNIKQIAASVQTALAPAMVSTGGSVEPAPAEAAAKAATPATPAENAAQPETPVATPEPAKPAEVAGQPSPDAPKSVEQAPLEPSKTSVIIRRGDTLWQISRRVYGKGIRYTTIYLANEDQITDPDRIRPGQVFGVPGKAQDDVDAEKVHRQHLQE